MKLSVIVAAYNAAQTIGKLLDDLAVQEVGEMEVIVVNDGSTDSTAEVVQSYQERFEGRLKMLTVSNGGQGRARNFALREARGEFIGFADADDRCAQDFYRKMLSKAEEEEADVVVCDFLRVYPDGTTRYEHAAMQDHPLSSAGAVWNKLYRRAMIGGVRFAEGLWYEDLLFSAKMLIKSRKTVFIEEALYYYQVGHPSTMTNSNSKKNLDILKILDEIRSYASKERKEVELDFLIINHVLLEAQKRVFAQKTEDSAEVLRQLNGYVHEKIPDLDASAAYCAETRNRRIIMKLLYNGHYRLADFLLKIKK